MVSIKNCKLKNKIVPKAQKTKVTPTQTQQMKKLGQRHISQSTHTQGCRFIKKS